MGWEIFLDAYKNFSSSVGEPTNIIFVLLFFTALIMIYALFVFYFYTLLAKKNIINLNLKQYTDYENTAPRKFLAVIFYILEYLIILPVFTLLWFIILSIFLLLLAKSLSLSIVLTLAAALVASVRISSYIHESLSEDLAKMIPFTILALALITPEIFSLDLFLERLNQIPSLFTNILYYLIFIIAIELIMRFSDLIGQAFKIKKAEPD